MRWIRRQPESSISDQQRNIDADHNPAALFQELAELNRFINRSAGRLPSAAVVKARWITDTLREILETTETRPLEIHAMLSVNGTVRDYLPTTLRTYLMLDDDAEVLRPSGRTPSELLIEQLDTLQDSASRTLNAVRNQDADALATQGNFLRVKFSRSDLDF